MKKLLGLLIALNSFFVFSQNDCSDAIIVCGNSGYQDLSVTGFGIQELNNSNSCTSQENNSIWFKLTINTSGTLGFTLTPTSNSIYEDFDFFVFGPNVSCGNIGQAIRCSTTNPFAAGQGNNLTGMNGTETDTSEGPGTDGNSFIKWLDVVAGESYFLVVDRPVGTSNFSIEWTGTATFNQQPTFNNLTPETLNIEQCDTDNVLDEISTFDLTVNDNIAIGTQNNVEITYHTSNNDTILGENKITTPQAYQNTINPQIIYVRLTNTVTQCYTIAEFTLTVVSPVLGTPATLTGCDSNNNGISTFDLSLNNNLISTDSNMVFSYFSTEANALSNNIANQLSVNYTNINGYTPETIWVRVENPITGCFSVTSFSIQVYNSPETTQPTNINQCDDDNDGFYSFDLHALKDTEILNGQNPTEFEVLYFTSQTDADNGNTANAIQGNYTNSSAYSSDTIFAKIQNINSINCYQTISFIITVFESPNPPTTISNYSICDSNITGTDIDEIETFDLTTKTSEILDNQSPTDFNVTYYLDVALTNQISTPNAFSNTSNPQTIYAKIVNNNNVTCSKSISFILEVFELPTITNYFEFKQCDEDGVADGYTDFNLNEANDYLTNNNTSLNVTYYSNSTDAESGSNTLNPSPFSNQTQSTVYARIENANGCYRVAQVDLLVSSTHFPVNYLKTVATCDTDDINDGISTFILTDNDADIINQFPSGQNLTVSYYRNLNDVQLEQNEIDKNNPYSNEVAENQTIFVRVESQDNGACFGLGPHLQLVVNKRPEFELDTSAIYCKNLAPITISPYNQKGNYTYEWYNSNGNLFSTSQNAVISSEGLYTVYAISQFGCESFPKSIQINPSIIATITQNDITVIDDTANNSITINTSNLGIGDYEFALDEISGFYQDEPVFTNVAPGIHTIYIQDENNCGIAQIDVSVIGYPKFLTPNNDGINDTWKVLGVDKHFYPNSNIYIFDRFGKLIIQIDPKGEGWNGTFNGQYLPASDYWFSVELIDYAGNVKIRKGHFSLIRR